jgi:hypothetical protein
MTKYLGGRMKVAAVTSYGRKTPNTKKIREKHVEWDGEIRKEERVREENSLEAMG